MRNSYTELPDDWTTVTLGHVCDILDNQRIPVSSDERAKRGGDIPYYGANGQVGWIDNYIFEEELVLIAEDGGNFDEYADRAIAYRISGKSWVNNHVHVLRAKPETTNGWVYHCLVHKDIRFYIRGGTRSKLNQSELRDIEIPFPPYYEQGKITEILDTLDDTIRKTEQLIAKLKQIKQGLLHDLLTRGIDENGQLRDPIAHPEQFKDSVLGRIPKEWRVVPLRQLVESLDAGVSVNAFDYPAASGQIGVLKTSAVNGGQFYPGENKAVLPNEISRVRVRPEADSIIVSRMNTPELVGEHGYVDEFLGDLYLPDRLWLVTFKNRDLISARWLSFFLSTPPAKRHITLHATGTSGSMKNLPKDKFLAMLIPLPELAEQDLIAEMLKSHEGRIRLESSHLQRLQAIKKALMHDLLTGKVRVTTSTQEAAHV